MEERKTISIKDLNIKDLLDTEVKTADISRDLPFRKWLYSWMLDPAIPGNFQGSFDKWIGILIIANLFSLIFENVPGIYEPYKPWFEFFDLFSIAVFTVEYLLRFYLAAEDAAFKGKVSSRLAYVFSPFAIIDALAIVPFYLVRVFGLSIDLHVLKALRILRLLKIFRIVIPAYHEFAALNRGRTFRQKIHALIFESAYGGRLQEMFELFIAMWVLVSVFAVILESVHGISYLLNVEFVILDAVAVAVFTIEYCMRMYSCVEEPGYEGTVIGRWRQAKHPSTLIDFLAILPFFLEVFLHHLLDLRFLRVFRLTRLLKLTRGNDATATLVKVVSREWPVIAAAAFIMILLVVLTASLGYLFEYEAQPDKFENIPTSIYWAVITLASVGYGDISPVTVPGRAMTIVLAFIGIGIFAIPAALLSSAFSDELQKERDELKNNLYKILKDGVIDADEIHTIRHEAHRMHLSVEEVNALIKLIQHELEKEAELQTLPISTIAQRPELAVEHYKSLISDIRRLALLTDEAAFDAAVKSRDSLSAGDMALWRQIQGKS
ncbi:MAG: ion transporter [Betaproteobacteria bacterium]|jgi:voltage-gated potassium channel Kch